MPHEEQIPMEDACPHEVGLEQECFQCLFASEAGGIRSFEDFAEMHLYDSK